MGNCRNPTGLVLVRVIGPAPSGMRLSVCATKWTNTMFVVATNENVRGLIL